MLSLDHLLAIEGEVHLSLSLDLVSSKIGNINSKTEIDTSDWRSIVSHTRFIFAGQAPHPPFKLPIKSSGAIETATTVDFSYCVVSLVKQLQAFFYAISSEQIVKSCVGETT